MPTDFERSAMKLMAKPGDFSVWEYYLENTKQFGEYTVFSHYGTPHARSQFIRDIEALAAFYKEELGLQAQDVVTVFMPTCVEGIINFYALNKIGVIVNFVHPLLSSDKVKAIMDFTGSKGLVMMDMFVPAHTALLESAGVPLVVVNPKEYVYPDCTLCATDDNAKAALDAAGVRWYGLPEAVKAYKDKRVDSIPHGKEYVCVYMNGGGTTGESKTIILSNFAINSQVYMLGAPNSPTAQVGVDTEICCMPFFHAFGLCAGGLSAINMGHKVVFLAKFDAEAFVKLMKENHVLEFNGVPNMYKKLVATPSFDCAELGNVEKMFVGGDYVSADLCDQMYTLLRKHGSKAEFCAGYGLTECAAACTVNPVWANKFGTIGKPLPGLRIEIWDDDHKKVPAGTVGEIVITGDSMMNGYLTPDRLPNVGLYFDDEGTPWVLTGDLGKMDDESYITFAGRKKRVIIISGYNVFPVDIEKIAEALPEVRECCAVQGFAGDKPIIRLFIAPVSEDIDKAKVEAAICEETERKLNRFSVPRDFRYVDALPRTKLEKVDFMRISQFSPDQKI